VQVDVVVVEMHFPVPGGAVAPASQAASVVLGPASETSRKKVAICLLDSPLEGTGFEPSVPPKKRRPSRAAPRPRQGAAKHKAARRQAAKRATVSVP
jgi:hypothetical protein